MKKNLIALVGIIGVIVFIATSILGGSFIDGYSHVSQFISESYATGTQHGEALRFYGFLPSGLCFFVFALFAPKYFPKSNLLKLAFLIFGIFYGLGTIIVSFYPCDAGCNKEFINPSISQIIHNVTGALTYLIVPAMIIFIGFLSRRWEQLKGYAIISIICGIIALLFSFMLSGDPTGSFLGLFQRIVEGSILIWIILTAIQIQKSTNI